MYTVDTTQLKHMLIKVAKQSVTCFVNKHTDTKAGVLPSATRSIVIFHAYMRIFVKA